MSPLVLVQSDPAPQPSLFAPLMPQPLVSLPLATSVRGNVNQVEIPSGSLGDRRKAKGPSVRKRQDHSGAQEYLLEKKMELGDKFKENDAGNMFRIDRFQLDSNQVGNQKALFIKNAKKQKF